MGGGCLIYESEYLRIDASVVIDAVADKEDSGRVTHPEDLPYVLMAVYAVDVRASSVFFVSLSLFFVVGS